MTGDLPHRAETFGTRRICATCKVTWPCLQAYTAVLRGAEQVGDWVRDDQDGIVYRQIKYADGHSIGQSRPETHRP